MEFFIDSNIVIESLKKNYNEEAFGILEILLSSISKSLGISCYINSIVESEVAFQIIFKGKSEMNEEKVKEILLAFKSLEIGENIRSLLWEYIEKYNLRPNDAIILATCKHYNIPYLISLDNDFKEPCKEEGITLINSTEKLKEILNKK